MSTSPATAGVPNRRLWWLYLLFGAVVCVLYVFVPPLKGTNT